MVFDFALLWVGYVYVCVPEVSGDCIEYERFLGEIQKKEKNTHPLCYTLFPISLYKN